MMDNLEKTLHEMAEIERENHIQDLSPCPHCGESCAEMETCHELGECANFENCPSPNYFSVVCNVGMRGCGASGGYYDTKEKAAAAWNRRAPLAEPVALTVEELRKNTVKPVWVFDLLVPSCSAWHFPLQQDGTLWLIDRIAMSRGIVGYNVTEGCHYGKTWLAYDREPGGE